MMRIRKLGIYVRIYAWLYELGWIFANCILNARESREKWKDGDVWTGQTNKIFLAMPYELRRVRGWRLAKPLKCQITTMENEKKYKIHHRAFFYSRSTFALFPASLFLMTSPPIPTPHLPSPIIYLAYFLPFFFHSLCNAYSFFPAFILSTLE